MKTLIASVSLAVALAGCAGLNKVLDTTDIFFSDDVNELVADGRAAADTGKKLAEKAKEDAGAVTGSDIGNAFDEAKALFDAAKDKLDEARAKYDAAK